MRAGKAYIASLGTTSLLVVASILLIVLAGTLLAFKGSSGSDRSQPVESILLGPEAADADERAALAVDEALAAAAGSGDADRGASGGGEDGAGDPGSGSPGGGAGPGPVAQFPVGDSPTEDGPRGSGGGSGSQPGGPAAGGSTPVPDLGVALGAVVAGVSPDAGQAVTSLTTAISSTLPKPEPESSGAEQEPAPVEPASGSEEPASEQP